MDGRVDFDLNESLKHYLSDSASVPTPEASTALADCENDPESLTSSLIDDELTPIIDAVAESPDAVTRAANLDSLQFLLKCSSYLPTTALSKILDLIVSALAAETDAAHADIQADEQEAVPHHKQVLEILGFLLQWSVAAVEAKAAERPATTSSNRGRTGGSKGAKGRSAGGGGAGSASNAHRDGNWDSMAQILGTLDVMSKSLKLKLAKVFVTTSERDTFISLFTRPVYQILESENRTKNTSMRMHAFKVLCIAVKHHGHAFGAQTSVLQNLSYFEHLAEPMAEFVHILSEQYDYPQLAEEILRELSNKEFNANDTKGPKSVSTFITKISDLAPRLVIKQMTLLAKLLDSESYTLRCSIVEVCGNLIAMLSKQEGEERSENHKSQINAFFEVLEERFLDVNPYCRSRTIQVYYRLCDLDTKFPKRRQAAAELTARSLEDKSSNVRRNAVKLLAKLVSTHPFGVMHGGQLSHKDWQARLDAVEAELNALKPPEVLAEKGPGVAVDPSLLQDPTEVTEKPDEEHEVISEEQKAEALAKAASEAATAEVINKLQLTRRYYSEAVRFIEVIRDASAVVTQLLSSKNKSEVIEAMDFFVVIDAYKIETARLGIRRMLRLIWTKGNSDEGKGVQTHLIECYKGLFFDAPDTFSANDASNYIARNMISLTFGATPAELTSLEQLLSTMMQSDLLSPLVVEKLWQVYGVQNKDISRSQRRGAIIVLGMLALADPEVVVKDLETCLRIGLGNPGKKDFGLARYTCTALMRIKSSRKIKDNTKKGPQMAKLPNDHAVLVKLAAMTELVTDNPEWFGLAEQAIGAIYALSRHPDVLSSDIIRRKTKYVFGQQKAQAAAATAEKEENEAARHNETGLLSPPPEEEQNPTAAIVGPVEDTGPKQTHAMALSQLLFIVGHVAIKQIVHLELCEQDFKRRKAEKEKNSMAAKADASRKGPSGGANASTTSIRTSTATATAAAAAAAAQEEQDELDLIAGTSEDDFTEAIARIRERELLHGPNSLLASFGPLVTELCSNNTSYPDRTLQAQAALCMAKLMCVSSEYCERNLGLLLTILSRSGDATVRSNLVVALGDMAVCFNHLIDENTDFLYRRLNDADASVKCTCLMTLTFLILAGQVKVKGQLGEMAKCLEDDDRRIADLSRMFFSELATKDNAVYNHFVDMFSLLSADEELREDSFRKIIKFLTGFIEKDKHAKQLAAKLAARLSRCENERQWNDVAYAIGLLPHKDEEIQKMVGEVFKVVQATA